MTNNDSATEATIQLARSLRGTPPNEYAVSYNSIADLLHTHARTQPDAPFLIYYGDENERTEWSYAKFAARVAQMACYLYETLHIRRGERVATLAFNHPDSVLVYFACWTIGATVAPQNVSEDDARIGFILENAEVRVVLVRPEYAERARQICGGVLCVEHVVELDEALAAHVAAQSPAFSPAEPPTREDEALLVYTSGTTGAPKGVQLTQYNLLADAHGISQWHRIAADTRLMCILPIHHVNGIEVTLVTPLYAGGSVVLNRAFKASAFWQRVEQERVQIVSVVPTILQFLCEAGEDVSKRDLVNFRYCICGAGTLSVALAERWERQFNKRVLHGYGLSETTCYSCFLPVDLSGEEHAAWMRDHGYPSIGSPISINEMAIHNSEGNPVPDGEKGEIVVRGHNVMRGYFKRPDANAETFKHGWFRSGDEGFQLRDKHGRQFFFITGRLKELINRGGVKYSPFEIEEVLLQIPGVRVGLAVAFENTWYGEEVGAYIVREPSAEVTEAQVLAFCRARMPFVKAPKAVVFGQEVPVTTTGKYQRLRLQQLFTQWKDTQFRER